MSTVKICYDPDDTDSSGAPMRVMVEVDGEVRLYEPRAVCTLDDQRETDSPALVAMCSECGCETYTDDYCYYCAVCGASIDRGAE